ncbi:MAG: hypothetical protein U1G08_15400 [Verrucomicrobiota bacterium]
MGGGDEIQGRIGRRQERQSVTGGGGEASGVKSPQWTAPPAWHWMRMRFE